MKSLQQFSASLTQRKLWVFIPLFACLVMVVRTAWVCDDAYITFRTVENWRAGYGLVYNVGERVQTYTHPLWMFLISGGYLFTYKVLSYDHHAMLYFIDLALSFGLTVLVLVLLTFGISRSNKGAFAGLMVLAFSKAFVEYSTSGLENPLTHFLLALFFFLYFRQEEHSRVMIFVMVLVASLAGLNRLDSLVFYLPILIYVFIRTGGKAFWSFVAGMMPLILWELFSLLYYGFLIPNTAYAKLNTGIDRSMLLDQAMRYFQSTINLDPLTLATIGLVIVVVLWRRPSKQLPALLGLLLYLVYIVYIGGDFMSGRFFTAPLLLAVILLVQWEWVSGWAYNTLLAGIVILGLVMPSSVWRSPLDYGFGEDWQEYMDEYGVADERAVYYPQLGLLRSTREEGYAWTKFFGPNWIYQEADRKVKKDLRRLGVEGYAKGPNVHIVDKYALADPLLARLPVANKVSWRIGHFTRAIPVGYVETLRTGRIQFENDNLASYYHKLAMVVKGNLFDRDRLIQIWKFNTGQYDALVETYVSTVGP